MRLINPRPGRRARKVMARGNWSQGRGRSSASSVASVDKSAIKAHRTFLEVVLGDSGSQPTKHSEPERQKLAAETTSRIEKIERLIALVGDDESLAGHKASLEPDLAAAKKQVTKSSRPVAIEIEEKSKYISKTRLQQLSEDTEKAKSVLEARAVSFQREDGRLAELRAELVSVPAKMDVDASEIKDLERQEIEQLRLLAAERCPISLASKQKAVQDLQATIEAKRRRRGG